MFGRYFTTHCTPLSNPEAPFSIFGQRKEAYPSQQYGLMKVKHPEKVPHTFNNKVSETNTFSLQVLSFSLFFFLLSCPKIEANPDTVGVINSTQRWTICTVAAGASGWHMQVSQAARLPRGENRAAETQLLYPASVLYWLQLGTR